MVDPIENIDPPPELNDHPRRASGLSNVDTCFVGNGVPEGQVMVQTGNELKLGQRGAIIADDWGLRGEGLNVRIEHLHPHDETFRLAFLFNDIVDVPMFITWASRPDPWDLATLGLIRRTVVAKDGMIEAGVVKSVEYLTYTALNQREPGAWSLWREPDFDPIPEHLRTPDMAVRLKLQEALIVPSKEVPFDDVIEFRNRNSKHLIKLRQHLDDLALKISASGPDPAMFRLEIERLDMAIAEYTEEARKPNWKKALAGINVTINWADAVRNSLAGLGAAGILGIPLGQAAAIIGSEVATAIAAETTRGMRGAAKDSPFEYIAASQREFQ